MTGKYIIISAPSGAGKSTLIKLINDSCSDCHLAFSVSMATRNPREGEVDGKQYYFVSRPQFEKCEKEGGLLEWQEVHGNLYGTPREPAERMADSGLNVVFDVDVKGACFIKQHIASDALTIFIQPPSIEELRNRLVLRGTESEEQIDRRMRRVEEELTYAGEFDKIIINDDLERAASEFESILRDYLGIQRS